jgi:putative hemolysin
VMLEDAGLRMEVVASTDRRVDRVRVFPPIPVEKVDAARQPHAESAD